MAKSDKSNAFSDPISLHFGLLYQNLLISDLKKSDLSHKGLILGTLEPNLTKQNVFESDVKRVNYLSHLDPQLTSVGAMNANGNLM